MTEKNVWQFAGEIWKYSLSDFKNYDFNSTIRNKIHLVVKLFGNKLIERFLLTSQTEHSD